MYSIPKFRILVVLLFLGLFLFVRAYHRKNGPMNFDHGYNAEGVDISAPFYTSKTADAHGGHGEEHGTHSEEGGAHGEEHGAHSENHSDAKVLNTTQQDSASHKSNENHDAKTEEHKENEAH